MSRCEDKSDTIDQIIHKSHVAGVGEIREPNKVITVRIPQSLHEAIKEEAHQRRCSMNKLAAAKLRIKGEVQGKKGGMTIATLDRYFGACGIHWIG